VDKPTEFLLRLLGITTGGTYTFLTDDSGIRRTQSSEQQKVFTRLGSRDAVCR